MDFFKQRKQQYTVKKLQLISVILKRSTINAILTTRKEAQGKTWRNQARFAFVTSE
jgi:hypothetical protein